MPVPANQDAGRRVGGDQLPQQLRPARPVDQDRALLDARCGGRTCGHVRPHGIVQQRIRERMDLRGKRRGEQQVLPLRRHQGENAREFIGKAKIEQAICPVESEFPIL